METAPYFSSVHDPRVVGRCKHKLSDILMVALITYLCGGEDYSDMYQLCRFRGKEFKPLLELPNGCPSEDTFERVMQAVPPRRDSRLSRGLYFADHQGFIGHTHCHRRQEDARDESSGTRRE